MSLDTRPAALEPTLRAVRYGVSTNRQRPFIFGLCGAQGSGKSTLAKHLARALATDNLRAVVLSIDDFYLTRAERMVLAKTVHPLFATRGVPGTHDLNLAQETLEALGQSGQARLPRFDKAEDDRVPHERWDEIPTPVDIVILEGWCVGAVAQAPEDLTTPVNDLERIEDPQAIWRKSVNGCLATAYDDFFRNLDMLTLLAAPGFDVVEKWRWEQEESLRSKRGNGPGMLDQPALKRFIQHYQRLTDHILTEMPSRADLIINLDAERQLVRCTSRT